MILAEAMRIAFFDTHEFERVAFSSANEGMGHEIVFLEPRLTADSAGMAAGFPAICAFANDRLDEAALRKLQVGGTRLVALRSAGFNHIDLKAAKQFGLRVVRVPEYSPYAVAEHAVALLLTLNRKLLRAMNRVRELNFSLEGLVGFDLHGKTVGVVGTGRIGAVFARIMKSGFGCNVIAFDHKPSAELKALGVKYVSFEGLLRDSDVMSLHVPLTTQTHHLFGDRAFDQMKPGAILINTGRGALIDAAALIRHVKSGRLGGAALDVYEEEENVFFNDLSGKVLQDDTLARLLTFPNVLITSHQGFLTKEALGNIAKTTLESVRAFESGAALVNEVRAD